MKKYKKKLLSTFLIISLTLSQIPNLHYTAESLVVTNTIENIKNTPLSKSQKSSTFISLEDFFANPVGNAPNKITGNEIIITDSSVSGFGNEKMETGAIHSKEKINLDHSFEFKGSVNIASNPDGMALILHNDPRGTSAIGSSGGGNGYSHMENTIAVEFDSIHNGPYEGTISVPNNNSGNPNIESAHIAINPDGTSDLHVNDTIIDINDKNKYMDFIFLWDAKTSTLSVDISSGKYVMSYTIPDVMDKFKSNEVYLGITAAAHFVPSLFPVAQPNKFIFKSFKYTDFIPEIDTFINDSEGNSLSDTSEIEDRSQLTVTSKIKNKNPVTFSDTIIKLTDLENLDINTISDISLDGTTITKNDLINGFEFTMSSTESILTYKIDVKNNDKNFGRGSKIKFEYDIKAKSLPHTETFINSISTKLNAPILSGFMDKTIDMGININLNDFMKKYIIATDKEDGDLTSSITLKNLPVNTNTHGIYDIEISVKDSNNDTSTETVKLHITDTPINPPDVVTKKIDGTSETEFDNNNFSNKDIKIYMTNPNALHTIEHYQISLDNGVSWTNIDKDGDSGYTNISIESDDKYIIRGLTDTGVPTKLIEDYSIKLDKTPPSAKSSISNSGVNTSTLNLSDIEDPLSNKVSSGILKSQYQIVSHGQTTDIDSWNLYTTPVSFNTNDTKDLYIQIFDNAGNIKTIEHLKIEPTTTGMSNDTDSDGFPDINIDLSGFYLGNLDLNIDTDGNRLPDLNIDTNGDKLPNINIDTDGDGVPDININYNIKAWVPNLNVMASPTSSTVLYDTDDSILPEVNIDLDGDLKPDINIDTDGDGLPDINIDTDGDGKPTINVDTDGDGKPDINIDTDGDGKPDVNIDLDGDLKPDINIDTDGDGKPDINIDTDGDGKPDVNIDLDGDLKPDINIDTDGDGKPDINIDTDGDGVPDVNIDLDGDLKPDINIDTDGDGVPDVNIDLDGDLKPDINIDLDGDLKPDINIDTDGDGVPDMNIDLNGDGVPDINIDTNNDGRPDINIDIDGDNIPDINVDLDKDNIPDINIDTTGNGKPDINIDVNEDGIPDYNINDNIDFWNPTLDSTNPDLPKFCTDGTIKPNRNILQNPSFYFSSEVENKVINIYTDTKFNALDYIDYIYDGIDKNLTIPSDNLQFFLGEISNNIDSISRFSSNQNLKSIDTIDFSKVGEHNIVYIAKNKFGMESTESILLKINENPKTSGVSPTTYDSMATKILGYFTLFIMGIFGATSLALKNKKKRK
ncbi:MAG: hypothetical protein KFW09_00995 [Oscillospiraceae bacterium]|nr:hypothetical protein [Oscillospiraceae bacterium]